MLRSSSRCLALLAMLFMGVSAVAQQNPNGQIPVTAIPRPHLFLIRDPIVHKELNLITRQQQALDALNDASDASIWSMRNKPAAEADKMMREVVAESQSELSSLLTPDQLSRLRQIELWTLGPKAFMRDDLLTELELSENQTTELRDIVVKTQEEVAALAKQLQSGETRDSLDKQVRDLRTKEQKQIVAVLTREQQKQWLSLLGRRIDVSKLGRVRFRAPDIDSQGQWLNSEPLTLRQLKGKVVALHFYAFA
jgi:Spy/CpxP family protein refolding chaperone